MDNLNYHHLLYFYHVAKNGGIAAAANQLGITQPTLSVQIKELERVLGQKLLRRAGRGLQITDTGQIVMEYAEQIFGLGQELLLTLQGRPENRPMQLVVGVIDSMPKLIVHRLLSPVFRMVEPVNVICPEGRPDQLVQDLMNFSTDLILSDTPVTLEQSSRVFNHLLGESDVTVFASTRHAKKCRPGFPGSLADVPWLLPLPSSNLRRSLNGWFHRLGITPMIRGEFADSALVKVFGNSGEGVFALPSVIESDVIRQYDVEIVGRAEGLRERFYAISADRKITHPAVKVLTQAAKAELFTE